MPTDRSLRNGALVTAALISLVAGESALADSKGGGHSETKTPIKHVIIMIGENRTFDHVFATYKPIHAQDTVLNLLSEGIVRADGTPGQNYNKARQSSASDHDVYQLSPPKTPYTTLPPAMSGGPATPYGCQLLGITATNCDSPANEAAVAKYETAIDPAYLKYLLTGGNPVKHGTPDTRVQYDGQGPTTLPPGPFQLTSATLPYDSYAASPVHRLFQMWQQLDCSTGEVAGDAVGQQTKGCHNDLFPWVEVTIGAGSNGAAQPPGFTNE